LRMRAWQTRVSILVIFMGGANDPCNAAPGQGEVCGREPRRCPCLGAALPLSRNDVVVLGVRADPEPQNHIALAPAKGSIAPADAH
jgi:hypothetical protein